MLNTKILTLLAALACLPLAATSASATAPCPTKWTKDGFVALRSGPGTNYPIVKKLWFVTAVDLYRTGHTRKWLRVSVNGPNGIRQWRGYVAASLIDLNSCG